MRTYPCLSWTARAWSRAWSSTGSAGQLACKAGNSPRPSDGTGTNAGASSELTPTKAGPILDDSFVTPALPPPASTHSASAGAFLPFTALQPAQLRRASRRKAAADGWRGWDLPSSSATCRVRPVSSLAPFFARTAREEPRAPITFETSSSFAASPSPRLRVCARVVGAACRLKPSRPARAFSAVELVSGAVRCCRRRARRRASILRFALEAGFHLAFVCHLKLNAQTFPQVP
jgi:hypothetical protein